MWLSFRRALDILVDALCAGTMGAIVVIAIFQVANRFALQLPFAWTEELARFLAVWICLLGAARCVREGSHIAIDVALTLLPRRLERALEMLANLLFVVLALALIHQGIKILPIVSRQFAPASGVSMFYVYLAIPVSSAILLVYLIMNFFGPHGAKDRATNVSEGDDIV